MEITKCLTISTAHVTENTAQKLSRDPNTNELGLCVYEKGEHGYWIVVPDYRVVIPADLAACLELARKNDCRWLCLDRDGEEVHELPTYDW